MKRVLIVLCVLLSLGVQGQKERKIIREGNELFHKGQYDKATEKYGKAIEKEKHPVTLYNQGTAQYKNKKFDEAIVSLQASVDAASSPDQKAKAHFNLGDAFYKKEQFDQSINQFKEALKIDPKDEDSKRNLLIAKMKKKQMETQQKNNDKNKDDKDQESKDNESKQNESNDKNQKQEENDQKKQDNSSNKDESDSDKSKPGQQPKLSKDEMKRLTDFIEGEDQKVQEKLQRVSKSPNKPLKDW